MIQNILILSAICHHIKSHTKNHKPGHIHAGQFIQEAATMLYLINFTYKDPASGQTYQLKGIKEGRNPGEAEYYFMKQYPRHKINITDIKAI